MYIAASIREDFDVKIIDRNIDANTDKIIKNFSPDVLGISSFTAPMILDGLEVSRRAKEMFGDNIIVVWGGVHPTLLPEQTLREKSVDIVVRGEGEITFLELLNALKKGEPLNKIRGIGYKNNKGEIILTEERGFIENLDDIPHPAWDLVNARKYLKYETPIITSRGCPHHCAFCYNQFYSKRKWRGMSVDRVIKEIEYLESLAPMKRLKVYDDNFTVNKKRFFAILDNISKDIPLWFETRVDYINEKFVEKIKPFSDPYLFLGIESGSPAMLKKLKKDITIQQIKHAFELLNKNRIDASASFMIGLPNETKEEVQMTLKLLDEINPTRFTCCIYTPYPGSLFYDEIVKENSVKLPQSLVEWGKFSSLETASINASNVDTEYLEKIYKNFWYKSVRGFIKRRRYKWLYIGIRNYLDIKYLNLLRYFRP